MLARHDGRDERCCDICKALVGSNDGCWRVRFIVAGCLQLFGRVGAVVLVRVGRQGAQADGDAWGLEVGRVEGDDSNDIVVVRLEVLDSDGRFLRRDVADYSCQQ